jgi:Nucleotidyl transferase AbiEii toxin, Type IV TA system
VWIPSGSVRRRVDHAGQVFRAAPAPLDRLGFTSPGRGDVQASLAAFAAVTAERVGTSTWFERAGHSLAVVRGEADAVVVDLAVDATPQRPPTVTFVGPTLDPDELAARKVVALFDRAEARDFADVYVLAARYGTRRLLELAAAVDAGFDIGVLATMLDSLTRFSDQEIPVPVDTDIGAMREFFRTWSEQLRE